MISRTISSNSSATQSYLSCDSNRIKKLPPLLINQLAAGEVVTRPASVVKELLENAIDAGASVITIRITQGGMGLIEVIDNGCGIHPDDITMAVTRFATSKIADVSQLHGIATLGFRGEALAATAAVSRLTLKSSSDDSGIGRELTVAGILEDTPTLVPVVHPQGTTVIVKDLYFNVPARRGNLKSISTEFAHIETVVKQLALVASNVAISLWHNDKRRFYFEAIKHSPNFTGTASVSPLDATATYSQTLQGVLARLTMILPSLSKLADKSNFEYLQPLDIALDGLKVVSTEFDTLSLSATIGIYGFLIPCYQPSVTTYKLIYINGRLVKDRRIAQSLIKAASSIPSINDLGYVLFFELPHSWLNVNVHPSKQCIKIQNLSNISAHLEMGVKSNLLTWYNRQVAAINLQQATSLSNNSQPKTSSIKHSKPPNNSRMQNGHIDTNSSPKNYVDKDIEIDKIMQSDSNDFNTSHITALVNKMINEPKQVYNIQDNSSSMSNSQLICLYRQPISKLKSDGVIATELLNNLTDKLLLNPVLQAFEHETLTQNVLVLLQWQEVIYVFEETSLLNSLNCPRCSDIDSLALHYVTERLRALIEAMSPLEVNKVFDQALTKLSMAEIAGLLLKRLL